jgi:septation ring formation regulator EzrA
MGMKAEESHQVQKARKKLEKKMAEESRLVNEKAISQMKKAIQIWLERHKNERLELAERLELFDENRHPVKTKSKFVSQLLDQLETEADKSRSFKPLIGRIKK